MIDLLAFGPFDSVFDVGGNNGAFAELARNFWPAATITSFEPVPELAAANTARAAGRWWVVNVAISDTRESKQLRVCVNQHTASTMHEHGPTRRRKFGIADRFETIDVRCELLDHYIDRAAGRLLVKLDVEGHEAAAIAGARLVLDAADTVVVECNQDPEVFVDAPAPGYIDDQLRRHGLAFAGVIDALQAPDGSLVQFDGVWRRV